MTPKTTAFAPIAKASVNTAAKVNPFAFRNTRRAKRTSRTRVSRKFPPRACVAFLFELCLGAKFDARAPLSLGPRQA